MPYEYNLVGPLNIIAYPCEPSYANLSVSTFDSSQTVLTGIISAFFELP
jgi:hypothetical protein